MPKLTINNKPVDVPAGTSILNAARTVGVKIPSLCYLEGVHVYGGCRVCLVEVEGARALQPSCTTPVATDMKVHTNTPRVRASRRTVVELLLSDHDGECQVCARSADCEFQAVARDLDVREIHFTGAKHRRLVDTSTPALDRDSCKCIMCRRCITVCSQIQETRALWAQDRGFECVAAPAFGHPLDSVACVQCGQCAAVCPTAAIVEKDHIERVWAALTDKSKRVVAQIVHRLQSFLVGRQPESTPGACAILRAWAATAPAISSRTSGSSSDAMQMSRRASTPWRTCSVAWTRSGRTPAG